MKILSVVVTYFPNRKLLINNINAFIDSVDKVLIWENTPENEKIHYRFVECEKIEYCGDGINSISHALNFAWIYAKKNGYNYILTMDQDSLWEDFCLYLNKTIFNKSMPLGIWGPNTFQQNFDKYIGLCQVDAIITSGMLLDVEIVDKIGGWNELFSIDCVDYEFCLKAKDVGVNVYLLGDCHLIQRYGTPKKVKMFGHEAQLRNDSPARLYSIYRSLVVLMRMFPSNLFLKRDFWDNWMGLIKWILVFEDNRVKKVYAIFRGILSGIMFHIN